MKYLTSLTILVLLSGCGTTSWKDTGEKGPWCASETRARVFYRTVDYFMAPNPQGEVAYEDKSGTKRNSVAFWQELDKYFSRCTFINQWSEHGTVDSVGNHNSPFDLYLVSMNPTVVVGVEKKDHNVSSMDSPYIKKYVFVGSTYLLDPVEVITTLPYHSGAKVVWFSPAVDYDLHQIDLGTGAASFLIDKKEQINVVLDEAQLTTLRK
jgi:hypothetical protein